MTEFKTSFLLFEITVKSKLRGLRMCHNTQKLIRLQIGLLIVFVDDR